MKKEMVLVLDFGGQYNQLIARRVREQGVYCEVLPYNIGIEKIKELMPKGVILTGGPSSVHTENAPMCDREVFNLGIPILGICYGAQLIAHIMGGRIEKGTAREYGKTVLSVDNTHDLFHGVESSINCWMSHTDHINVLPDGFVSLASTESCEGAAIADDSRGLYGVQFHPEVVHTSQGKDILGNFLFKICNCIGNWEMASFVKESIKELKEKIGNRRALCALSGGVDSSVTAALLAKAIGKQLVCIYVDHGLMRKNESDEVERVFNNQFDINLIKIDAQKRFVGKLKGVIDPEKKRKIIGEEFIKVFEEESKKLSKIDFLAQGTIYPDVIESGIGDAAVIKSHHNVGGLPEHIDFEEIIEPLRFLFKDEVRVLGLELGLPGEMVFRQPFPGPGLGIRIIGEVTEEKLDILREADAIYREEIKKAGLDRDIWQYFAVLTDMRSVGVMGDERTYDYTLALRAVTSTDGMTADWAKIPYDVLENISSRIVNNVKEINRIVYDITTKPPATIEWE